MTSCERKRCSAYSEDMRWRIVWQREALSKSINDIAVNLCIDKSTVSRVLRIFHTSGNVSKKKYPKGRAICKLTPPVQIFIMKLIINNPGILLREVQKELNDVLFLKISIIIYNIHIFCIKMVLQNRNYSYVLCKEVKF